MHTTLKLLAKYRACEPKFTKFKKKLGEGYTEETPISFLTILSLQGLDDSLWAMRAVPLRQRRERDTFCRLLACDYAERVLPNWERAYPGDTRPRQAIDTARCFARGEATNSEMAAAWDAAEDAAWAAARAAWDAAEDAAWAAWAASRAAEREWQTEHLREMLAKTEKGE